MGWVKVKWIPSLFAAFDLVFPNRLKGSDGTIGDKAHEGEVSGHNPDDTKGVRAERQDADTIAEVRAADVTSSLRSPASVKMIDVVYRILRTPADRDRLIYIICDGNIWRAANNWVREDYHGPDKHFGHAHFSGNPVWDENGAPWLSVLSFLPAPATPTTGDEDEMSSLVRWSGHPAVFRTNGIYARRVQNEALLLDEITLQRDGTYGTDPARSGSGWESGAVRLVAHHELIGKIIDDELPAGWPTT